MRSASVISGRKNKTFFTFHPFFAAEGGWIVTGNLITFPLEKWRLKATTDWFFNPNEEGISIPRANLYTGLIDPVLENLLIKPDFFEVDIKNVKGFTLGGIAQFVPNCLPKLFYDPFEKHYQLSFLGTGNQPAGFVTLSALGSPIGFNNFTFNSANQFQPSIRTTTVKLLEIADCQVNTMQVTPGQIELGTTLFLGLNPEVSLPLQITYTNSGDTVAYAFKPGACSIETPGNVTFLADALQIQKQQITAAGTLKISANAYPGSKAFNLVARFTKTPGATFIVVNGPESTSEPRQLVAMGSGRGLSVQRGRQTFANGKWDNLGFDAYFQGFTNLKQDSLNHYTVHGAIDMKDGKLELSSIETPFGGLTVVLDFDEMAVHGNLEQRGVPMPMGPVTLNDIDVSMDMDKRGFLLYGNARGDIAGLLTNVGVGLMVGYYEGLTEHQKNEVLDYSLNKQFPNGWIGNNFAGVYLNVSKEFINKEIDLGVLDAHIFAGAQVDALLSLAPIQCNARVAVAASAEARLDLLVCDLCLGVAGEVVVEAKVGENGASLDGCGSLAFALEICEVPIHESVAIKFSASTKDGLEVKFGSECDQSINQRDPCGD